MSIDYASLLIAMICSGAAVALALLVNWLNARRDAYLASWAIGILMIVVALAELALQAGEPRPTGKHLPYALMITGTLTILAGVMQFRSGAAPRRALALFWLFSEVTTLLPMWHGLTGIGSIMLNFWCGVILLAAGWECWLARREAPLALIINAGLFVLTAISFFACSVMVILSAEWIITTPPRNWAETFNAIMSIIALAGIGTMSLMLSHARTARRHLIAANTDPLTGLLNRRALFDLMTAEAARPGMAVLMIDLDNFKQLNDRRGHADGDIALQRFSQILRSSIRDEDLAARLGGEEFCAVLRNVTPEIAMMVAERIRSGLETAALPLGTDQGPDHGIVTVSIGLAMTLSPDSFEAALARADAALYRAKNAGRNQIQVALQLAA